MGIIYQILNVVNNKKYIGLSRRPFEERKQEHLKNLKGNRHCNRYLQNAWNKYGEENFEFSILENVSLGILLEKEEFYITKLQTNNENYGYNLTSGGECSVSNEVNIQARRKGARKVNLAQYDSDGILLKKFSSVKEAERELNISDTDIHRACKKKWRVGSFQFRKGLEIREKIDPFVNKSAESKFRKVIRYSIEGIKIDIWDSIKEASTVLNIPSASIQQSCQKRGIAYGFIWRYVEDPIILVMSKHKRKQVYKLDINNEIIQIFVSLTECAKILGIDFRVLSYCIYKKKMIGDFYYSYECETKCNY